MVKAICISQKEMLIGDSDVPDLKILLGTRQTGSTIYMFFAYVVGVPVSQLESDSTIALINERARPFVACYLKKEQDFKFDVFGDLKILKCDIHLKYLDMTDADLKFLSGLRERKNSRCTII
jgi:hypothetical protein